MALQQGQDALGRLGGFPVLGFLGVELGEGFEVGGEPAGVVHHCGSGVSALPNLLAMEIAGLSGSALYAGSWSDWCSDPARPVAQG